jgi:hypothetical protein
MVNLSKEIMLSLGGLLILKRPLPGFTDIEVDCYFNLEHVSMIASDPRS